MIAQATAENTRQVSVLVGATADKAPLPGTQLPLWQKLLELHLLDCMIFMMGRGHDRLSTCTTTEKHMCALLLHHEAHPQLHVHCHSRGCKPCQSLYTVWLRCQDLGAPALLDQADL